MASTRVASASGVQAFWAPGTHQVAQVTINMVNYQGTPLFRVFETVKSEAARYGVNVIGSEIIGLTPMQALLDVAEFYLRLDGFDRKQVLEDNL